MISTATFHIIEDATVITYCKGVYKQCKVYMRGERIFAGHSGGFIRLQGSSFTSKPDVSYECLQLPPELDTVKGEIGEPLLRRKV